MAPREEWGSPSLMAFSVRPAWVTLPVVLTASLSGLALGLTLHLWLYFGNRKRRRSSSATPPAKAVRSEARSLAEELQEAAQDDAGSESLDKLRADFEGAVARVSSAPALSTEAKLAFYGYYKQALCGDCPSKRPWGMEALLKWEAWNEHRGTSTAEAMRQYIACLDKAVPGWKLGVPSSAEPPPQQGPKEGSGMTMGPTVSVLQSIGDPAQAGEVDTTPVGQLCEKIAMDDIEGAVATLHECPELALQLDKDGMSPLHWACDRGHLEMVQVLLEMASKDSNILAHLNVRDGSGDTPLHFAALTDNMEIAQLLVTSRADPTVKNNDGESPISLAQGKEWQKIFANTTS